MENATQPITDQPHAAGFREWCKVELFGHNVVAGLVTVENLAGPMYRVDVPDANGNTLYTRYYAPAAVYALSPVARQIAIGLAVKLDAVPVARYELAAMARQSTPQLPGIGTDQDDDYPDDESQTC